MAFSIRSAMKAIASSNADNVMTPTLRNLYGSGVVLWFGFGLILQSEYGSAYGLMCMASDRVYDGPMLRAAVAFVRDQIRRRGELIPAGYSWSFVLLVDTSMVLILVAAMLQRTSADLPAAAAAALVALAPLLLFFGVGVGFLPTLVWVTSYAATVILLFGTSTPIDGDIAPALLVVALGSVAALVPVVYGTVALGSAVALMAVASAAHRLDDVALYLGMAALGWLVGVLTRMQAHLLITQREMQAELAEHAADDERRRIAREVHDVIAHSLSITLLHLTGARRALQQDRDIDAGVDALVDAERLGRQAMSDIRRTVGLLETGPTAVAPEPGLADIDALVRDFTQAGLAVSLQARGPTDRVSAAEGLALYRITQESLANIAKHAPTSNATVEVTISSSMAELSIVNEVPLTRRMARASADGRGIRGMRQRVELLNGIIDIGPCLQGWSVRAEIPLTDSGTHQVRSSR